jgi:hypothetical protein
MDAKWTKRTIDGQKFGFSKVSASKGWTEPVAACLSVYKEVWYARQDSNLRPLAPEASALSS